MNDALQGKTCTPCRGGMPPLTRSEAENFLAEISAWRLDHDAPDRA